MRLVALLAYTVTCPLRSVSLDNRGTRTQLVKSNNQSRSAGKSNICANMKSTSLIPLLSVGLALSFECGPSVKDCSLQCSEGVGIADCSKSTVSVAQPTRVINLARSQSPAPPSSEAILAFRQLGSNSSLMEN
jgi:hypothetical protein